MSEQDPELFEIRLRQLGPGLDIDGILSKPRLVLLRIQAAQPSRDIQGGRSS